ncbi:hypothetical protein GVAV_001450 [Gurleya vavrai]
MTDIQEDSFYNQRSQRVKEDLKNNKVVYPHKYNVTHSVKTLVNLYSSSEDLPLDIIKSAGRIMAVRDLGKLQFIKIMDDHFNIQVVVRQNVIKEIPDFKRGDIIGFEGTLGRTKNGEFSIFATGIAILAPCLWTIPIEHFKIKDPELIYRKRYLDLILSSESYNRFITRSKVIKYIRNFLDNRDFLEVETPMMNVIPGGAAAKPFKTFHNELGMDLYMRISPELYLKTLVIGGMSRVYELGKDYRNEGIDLTHNPEFTTCEFYMAYADYNDIMDMTEEMLSGMVKEVLGTNDILYHPMKREQRPDPVKIDFSRPFKRIDIIEELNNQMKLRIENWDEKVDFTLKADKLEDQLEFMIEFCKKENIKLNEPKTLPRILDKLIGEYIESQCINPTFVMHHPLAMSPLAKKHRNNPFLTERFELFINGKEICNAYTELNDPFDQKERFEEQVKECEKGDDEAMKMDKGFVTAMEYGLPPTGGWGIGIDRFVMFLTNAANIRDVILFPTLKPEDEKISLEKLKISE